MLGDIFDFIREDMNAYLTRRQGVASGRTLVELSTILNADGSMSVKDRNLLLLTIVDIRENTHGYSYKASHYGAPQIDHSPIHLNFFLLCSAYFPDDRVKEALNLLGQAIGYFQSYPSLNHQNAPGLPAVVQKLTFELINQEFHERNHMWGLLGSKYMPSVLYKVQLLTVDEKVAEETPTITEVSTSG